MVILAEVGGVLVLLGLVAAVLVAVILALVWGLDRETGARDAGPDAAAWRADVSSLARTLETALDDLQAPVDPDRLQRTVLPMSGQFRRRAREAPAGTDGALVRAVYDLGVACQHLGVERSARRLLLEGAPIEDRVAELADQASDVAEAAETGGDRATADPSTDR